MIQKTGHNYITTLNVKSFSSAKSIIVKVKTKIKLFNCPYIDTTIK